MQEVPLDQVRRYGIVAGDVVPGVEDGRLTRVSHMVEKPKPEESPSRMGVAGRYVLTPGVFEQIRAQPRGAGGEIQLTDGIAGLLKTEIVHAYEYAGKRFDCGSKQGFLEATVSLALQHPEVGNDFREYLKAQSLG